MLRSEHQVRQVISENVGRGNGPSLTDRFQEKHPIGIIRRALVNLKRAHANGQHEKVRRLLSQVIQDLERLFPDSRSVRQNQFSPPINSALQAIKPEHLGPSAAPNSGSRLRPNRSAIRDPRVGIGNLRHNQGNAGIGFKVDELIFQISKSLRSPDILSADEVNRTIAELTKIVTSIGNRPLRKP